MLTNVFFQFHPEMFHWWRRYLFAEEIELGWINGLQVKRKLVRQDSVHERFLMPADITSTTTSTIQFIRSFTIHFVLIR